MSKFSRRDILLTDEQIKLLNSKKIALFGLGGVGGYTFEALVRMGIINMFICDGDKFQESNLNRQILSTSSNIGMFKTEVAKDRAKSINEDINIEVYSEFVSENNINDIDFSSFDYIIDAIDDTKAKLLIIKKAKEYNINIISMMGAGNRLKAKFIVSDIYKTKNDKLSSKMRSLLRKEGINSLKVVYTEDVTTLKTRDTSEIGSISYVVGLAGLILAQEVILDIINNR